MRSVLRGKSYLAPFSVLARNRLCSATLVKAITAKTLVILAEEDKEIAHSDSLNLAKTFGAHPNVTKIEGTDHKTVLRSLGALSAVASFLQDNSLEQVASHQNTPLG